MKIEELFGTLQMSVVSGWRKHLRSAKYGKHVELQEFYEEMPDKVDALIEAWMGANGKKVGNFTNILSSANMNTLSYLKELKSVCKQGYPLMGQDEELKSLLDDIVNLINSTLYKVKELAESNITSLTDFISEALINEAFNWEWKKNKKKIKDVKSAEKFLKDALADDSEYLAELAYTAMEYISDEVQNLDNALKNNNVDRLAEICSISLEGSLDNEDMEANCTSVMVALCLVCGADTDKIDAYLAELDSEMHEYMHDMFD